MIPLKIKYIDTLGEEETVGYTDGNNLFFTLRGQAFSGSSFNMLEPVSPLLHPEDFHLELNNLTDCLFYAEFPIWINRGESQLEKAILKGTYDYRNNKNQLDIELQYQSHSFHATKEYMEDILIAFQNQLPEGHRIQSCISCRYSNYHPVGNNDMGGLHCFRKLKQETEKIQDKFSLFQLWDEGVKENKLFTVQEFYLCNEFAPLRKTDWTYKSF